MHVLNIDYFNRIFLELSMYDFFFLIYFLFGVRITLKNGLVKQT